MTTPTLARGLAGLSLACTLGLSLPAGAQEPPDSVEAINAAFARDVR